MPAVSNPFVDYLTRYTTASPDHEAAFDEFIAQAPPPAGGPLRLATKVESFLAECFRRPDPPSVILTGNAGDGKTYLCRQVGAAFADRPIDDWDALAEKPLERGGVRLHVVKDLSELGEAQGLEVLRSLGASLSGANSQEPSLLGRLQGFAAGLVGSAPRERYLIAANEGRLRYLLGQDQSVGALHEQVDAQLRNGPEANSGQLIVINLTEVTTSTFVPETLRWMTADEHWADCAACPARERCPLLHNATRLRDPQIAGRVQLLYQLLEHLDIHVTVRDMLIHLAYTLTGNRRCHEFQQRPTQREDLSPFAYYQNIWGRPDDAAFRRKASVVQHLDRLHIGEHSLFEIDDFIVSGGQAPDEQEEHKRLFAPMVDLDEWRFAQDREAYLSGGADRSAAEEEQALRGWLPHCRRKLFFEWHAESKVTRLIPFLHFDLYQSLLRDERGVQERALRDIVTGLNRAFSRLYLTENEYLFVTTQYLHSGEQPRPLVRLRIPLTDLWLETVDRDATTAYNCERRGLYLVIAPPAQRRGALAAGQPDPLRWPLGLLQFEYLLRLAHGGTFNILADECELDVRSLKDQLLARFAGAPEQDRRLEFFVAERHRYSRKQLWIDEHGNIGG
jgi:hypothetical protein